MIPWETVAPAIKDAFTAIVEPELCRAASFGADWEGRPKGYTNPDGAELTIRITRLQNIGGRDEPRYTDEDDGNGGTKLVERLYGERQITIEAKVEKHHNNDAFWAWQTIEAIRTKLNRGEIASNLASAGVSVLGFEDPIPVNVSTAGRNLSAAIISVHFGVALCDTEGIEVDWIERIVISSKARANDGTLLPVPPNVTDKSIPDPAP